MILLLFGLYEQLNSHCLLRTFNPVYKPSIGLLSADKNVARIILSDKNHNFPAVLITIQEFETDQLE